MPDIWCAGEGEYFDSSAFEDEDGVLVHKDMGHTVFGEPRTFEGRQGALGDSTQNDA